MKIKLLSFFLILMCSSTFSQKSETELTINLLSNDRIADVNVEQEKFITSFTKVSDYCKSKFNELSENQKIGILIVIHKEGEPTYKVYSNPKIEVTIENEILKELNEFEIENTKLVDFPIFISINCGNKATITDFEEFVSPSERTLVEYQHANLQTKVKLNKEFAINEILPILNAYQTIVDEKFIGVKEFGKEIKEINFNEKQDVHKITSLNSNYWRATLEMNIGNQLIPITKIYALVSQGEFDYAIKYIEVLRSFSSPKTITNDYLENISFRLNLFNEELEKEINKGISEHDNGEYEKAINIYKNILEISPNSSWALYEKYFSENALKLKEKKISLDDRKDWDFAKIEIYKHNPLYNMNVRASNGREGYLLFRRQEISSLFKNKDEKLSDYFKYAEIASDLGIYDFAAQLFWLTATFDKDNSKKSTNNFLYCLDKLGETELKSNFKINFKKVFKEIEKEKDKRMKESSIYKTMRN